MDTTVKLKLGFAALMIASGIGVAMYPVISNAVAQRHASSVIESYNDTVQSMDTEKIDAAKEAARRYNEQLSNAIDRDAAGEAADTGLDDASADVVVGEAMLTMQGDKGKAAIVAEAARVQAESPVVDRWNEYMKDILELEMDPVTGAQPKLEQVFRLD